MKCPILFSGTNKKSIINLSSAEFTQKQVKVKQTVMALIILKLMFKLFSGESKNMSAKGIIQHNKH